MSGINNACVLRKHSESITSQEMKTGDQEAMTAGTRGQAAFAHPLCKTKPTNSRASCFIRMCEKYHPLHKIAKKILHNGNENDLENLFDVKTKSIQQ